MYLAYSPPLMLPTVTMNPTAAATAAGGAAATARIRARRADERVAEPMNKGARHIKRHDGVGNKKGLDTANLIWWMGLGMTVLGGAVYLS